MKTGILSVALICLVNSAAVAEPLSGNEKMFIHAVLTTALVTANCDYERGEEQLVRFGDGIGVDAVRFENAIKAAMGALGTRQYDRRDLIPEVTNATSYAAQQYLDELNANRSSFCRTWGEALTKYRLVKHK